MIIKKFRVNGRIRAYIEENGKGKYLTCTGKPSDYSCLSWEYDTLEEAERSAIEFINNLMSWKDSTKKVLLEMGV